jgi:hypothetical protein
VRKILITLLFSFLFLNIPNKASAQSSWSGVCVGSIDEDIVNGVTKQITVVKNNDVATIKGILCLSANLLQSATTILAFVGFLMFLYGGFTYMLSSGNTQTVTKAKQTMTFVVAGFILAIGAFVIINLISAFTGLDSILKIKFLDETVPVSVTPTP